MPIYEYQCPKCGEFEITQRITDNPLKKCPACQAKVRKLISSTSFQLKGSGWYVTDYARKDGKKHKDEKVAGAESKSEGDGGAEKESAGKSESKEKPAGKKDAAAKAA